MSDANYKMKTAFSLPKKLAACLVCLFFVFGLPACDKNTGNKNAQPSQEASLGESAPEESSPNAVQPVAETQEPASENETGVFDYAYTGATELKNVMPNSWQNLKRLTEESEEIFFAENAELMEMLEKEIPNATFSDKEFSKKRVYEEEVGFDIFYRIIFTQTDTPEFDNPWHTFGQALIYKDRDTARNVLVVTRYYSLPMGAQFYPTRAFTSIDIIRYGGTAKGVLVSQLYASYDDNEEKGYHFIPVPNAGMADYELEKPVGGSVNAIYYLISDFYEGMTAGSLQYPNIPHINISASDCLVNPAVPLRYALQSAFDGNPATSYVANTKNSLFTLRFEIFDDNGTVSMPIPGIAKLALINGYAQNNELYLANNRIKKIAVPEETELADGTLSFQFIDVPPECRSMNVTELYRGEKYNDTCMAEFNIKLDNTGWLFGDIDD